MVKRIFLPPTIRSWRSAYTDVRPAPATIVLWVSMVLCGGMLAWLSTALYLGYNTYTFDLSNMAQAIASVRRGQPLVFTYSDGPMSRLALHVELIYFLITPFFTLWPDARTLLVVQTTLFVLGALPVYRLAVRHIEHTGLACCLALMYLFYPTAQAGVLLDLHGDTLAMPLLLFALDALDRRSWRLYVFWLALALSCKFYVAAPVVILGLLLWWQGNRRAGIWTVCAGLLYGAVAFIIIRPLFTTVSTSTGHRNLSYVQFYFGQMQDVFASLDWRLANAVVVFGPALFLGWHGWRWLVPGLVIAAAALISTVGGSAGYGSHHYGIAVPFIMRAAIEGASVLRKRDLPASPTASQHRRTRSRRRRNWRGDIVLSVVIVLVFNIVLVDTPLSPLFWMGIPGRGLDENRYGIIARDQLKDRFLREEVPPQAPLAASLYLAPRLVDRETLYLVRYEEGQGGRRLLQVLPKVEYVVSDALFDMRQPFPFGGVQSLTSAEQVEIGQMLRDPDFGLVVARDGLLLFQRGAPVSSRLAQQVEVRTGDAVARQSIGNVVGFVDAQITPQGGRRYRATFRWTAGPEPGERPLVAVSTLTGIAGMRMVHLPSYALAPTTQWQPGQVIEEIFDVELPRELPAGRYQWQVGWYDLAHPESSNTDARSQVGTTLSIAEITVTDE